MASSDPYIIRIFNPNVHDSENQAIYLISERDDTKNTLILEIKNVSGSALSFTPDTPLSLSMKALLPPGVVHNIQVACSSPADWRSTPLNRDRGLALTPTHQVDFDNNATLTFTFTNIVFTPSEVDQDRPMMKDFVLSYSVPAPGEDIPLKVCLKRWVSSQQSLRNFEAAFVAVSEHDQGWNVKVNEATVYISKDADAVYSNSINGQSIRTRLAFRLTNKDRLRPLTLTSSSVFQLSFLPGERSGQLANNQDLASNIRIEELSTGDWIIEQATDEGSPAWTLTPKGPITLAAGGGSCNFLIDAVLANKNPQNNDGGAGVTIMYILYTNVPKREGGGLYDDSYLAATIEKVAPSPQIPTVTASPSQALYDASQPIDITWTAFGAENVQLFYTDVDGTLKSPMEMWHGTLRVTPPAEMTARRTTIYQCKSPAVAQSGDCKVVVKSVAESLIGVTLTRQGVTGPSSFVHMTFTSAELRFIDATNATINVQIPDTIQLDPLRQVRVEHTQFNVPASWTFTPGSDGAFDVSVEVSAYNQYPYVLGNGNREFIVFFRGPISLKLRGSTAALAGGLALVTVEPAFDQLDYTFGGWQISESREPVPLATEGMKWVIATGT
jgi:hypothetical protein